MRPEDKAELYQLVGDAMGYYRQSVSDFTLQVWWQACQSFEMEEVRKALTAHVMDAEHGQFPPKVADMVRILRGTTTDRAQLAWGKCFDAMSRVGAYTDVIFDDPAIHAAVEDLGGWPKICRTETKELSYLQHRFCESHKAYTGRNGAFDYPRRLAGDRSPDHEFERKGLALPRPALIGNTDACARVFHGGSTGGKTGITYTPVEALVLDNLQPRLAA